MTRPKNLVEFFERVVYPRLTLAAVYRDVVFQHCQGRFWLGDCPLREQSKCTCCQNGDHRHGIRVDTHSLRFSCVPHREKCGESVLAYFNGGVFPRPATGEYRAAVVKAADVVGVKMPELPDLTPQQETQICAQQRQAKLVETFFFESYRSLQVDLADYRCEVARSFLADHGFPEERLAELPVGIVLDREAMRASLQESRFTVDEIHEAKLLADVRLSGRLIGPIRDMRGRIVNFWAYDPGGQQPAFLFLQRGWKSVVPAFGLDAALRAVVSGAKEVVLVETLFDALLLRALGMPNVAAIGGTGEELTPRRWRRLAEAGVGRVTLVLNRRDEAMDSVEKAISNAFETSAPRVYYVDPEMLSADSPGQLARREGIDALRELIERRRVHAYRYKALAILAEQRNGHPWNEITQRKALHEAIDFYASQGIRRMSDLDMHFVPPIIDALGLNVSQPTRATTAELKPATRWWCKMHRCAATECFCFD